MEACAFNKFGDILIKHPLLLFAFTMILALNLFDVCASYGFSVFFVFLGWIKNMFFVLSSYD